MPARSPTLLCLCGGVRGGIVGVEMGRSPTYPPTYLPTCLSTCVQDCRVNECTRQGGEAADCYCAVYAASHTYIPTLAFRRKPCMGKTRDEMLVLMVCGVCVWGM
ncbi:hypothetical protein B0T18DRAFT_402853 [Schizothecium vesticola]|uniref:Extracellular membrane protein CFEM domain-containing protein n=1 Tax=Schizothecium vesticola TaxID=314040 RepID=A0AA40KA01_9PEZI|nr:hypothetical protein B0T18DRAFT_402853 [Schizothecium vesticola]